jgi:hypothetical protein
MIRYLGYLRVGLTLLSLAQEANLALNDGRLTNGERRKITRRFWRLVDRVRA